MRRKAPTPYEVKRADVFLANNGMAGQVSALNFAGAAKASGRSFERLLNEVKRLLAAGSGVGPAPIATEIALRGHR